MNAAMHRTIYERRKIDDGTEFVYMSAHNTATSCEHLLCCAWGGRRVCLLMQADWTSEVVGMVYMVCTPHPPAPLHSLGT